MKGAGVVLTRPLWLTTLIAGILIASFALSARPAAAETQIFDGELTAVSPTFNRPTSGSTPDSCSVSSSTHYATFSLVVPEVKGFMISHESAGASPIEDPFLALYGVFDPSSPCSGLVAADDDGGEGLNSRLHVILEPGTYTIVATTWGSFDTGTFRLTIESHFLEPAIYQFRDNNQSGGPTFNFVDISGTGTLLSASDCDDCVSMGVPIGFQFQFGAASFTTINVDSNGYAQFTGSSSSTFTNQSLPSTIAPALFPLWDDLNPGACSESKVLAETRGSEGSRLFIVQWHMVVHFSASCEEMITFQMILFEQGHRILFQYLSTATEPTASSHHGGSATVGIQWGDFEALEYSHNEPVITDGLAILFEPLGAEGDRTLQRRQPPRNNVSGPVGAIAAAASKSAATNRAAAAKAAEAPKPAATAVPRTGTTIIAPSTGDGALAGTDAGTGGAWAFAPLTALVVVLLTVMRPRAAHSHGRSP